jgi:hypothetical protein
LSDLYPTHDRRLRAGLNHLLKSALHAQRWKTSTSVMPDSDSPAVWRIQFMWPAVAAVALLLLSSGLGHYAQAPLTEPVPPPGVLVESLLNTLGGSLLALAAASSVAGWLPRNSSGLTAKQARSAETGTDGSEKLVRGALLCLALSLAIDTWWLQKVGLGAIDDAQQAGLAVSWVVYFVALRLRSSPQWRGWPWTAMLVAGFVCTLPMLIQVSWLGTPLPL